MFTETKKAGGKEFLLSIAVIVLLGTIGSYISYILPQAKVIGHLIGVVMIGIYGIHVIKRYCTVINYEEKEDCFCVSSSIGMRYTEKKLMYDDIKGITMVRPSDVKVFSFTTHMMCKKSDLYIILKGTPPAAIKISDDTGAAARLLSYKTKG